MSKVWAASRFLNEKGASGFAGFNSKDGPWVWKDSYVFVYDCRLDRMVAHPMRPDLVGRPLMQITDNNGKFIFKELCKAGEDPHGGWVEYLWTKPGAGGVSRKISYAKGEIDLLHADTVRLAFRLALEGDGTSGRMGVKAIAKHLNQRKLYTRTGGRWGVGAVHRMLTRPTYIGRHEFNKRSKAKTLKPQSEVIPVEVPALIDRETFDAVQALLKSRSPMVTPARVVSGPTLLTGICFCADCGGAMTLRTSGKGEQYRYYTCSIAARQGETGCKGRSVPMRKLDDLVASHLEQRLLDPERLEEVLGALLDRREERASRRRAVAAELAKRAAEADGRVKRLYAAIERGLADLDDPTLKYRIAELKATRDQARLDAERAAAALEINGQAITLDHLRRFAEIARRRMRTPQGYRRDHLRALAQRVEVADGEVRIMGSKTTLLRTLTTIGGVETAAGGVRISVPNWRECHSYYRYFIK